MKKLIKSCSDAVTKRIPWLWLRILMLVLVLVIIILISRLSFGGGQSSQRKLVAENNPHEYSFPTKKDKRQTQQLSVAGQNVEVVVADTTTERSIGLSNYVSLEPNTGMLFVFDDSDYYSFWMRDMDFAIDIIWINEDRQVVFVKENAMPADFPESYKPDEKALYVLEVPSGFVARHGITLGTAVNW